jgi:hypothetical protein
VSQIRFVYSHATSTIFPNHQGILCQSVVFLTSLICAQDFLVAWSHHNEAEGHVLPSTSPGWDYPRRVPRLLKRRPPKTTGVANEDTETESSWQGKIYFCRRVCRHTGTALTRSRLSMHFYPRCSGALSPLLRLVELGCTVCSRLAYVTLGICEWGRQ